MESILKSEIFFFISSISVILITSIFVIIGIYLIKMMRNFSKISDRLKETVDGATSSLTEVGDNIKESPLYIFFFGKKRKKKESKK
ncbi:MAG: DUF948 domain-containing protein [Candidatus Paceibacterota bacterium]